MCYKSPLEFSAVACIPPLGRVVDIFRASGYADTVRHTDIHTILITILHQRIQIHIIFQLNNPSADDDTYHKLALTSADISDLLWISTTFTL